MSLSQSITQAYPDLPEAFSSPFSVNSLRKEYKDLQALFQAQASQVKDFLEAQAGTLADLLLRQAPLGRVRLPDRLILQGQDLAVPSGSREFRAGGWLDWFSRTSPLKGLSQRLAELEGTPNRAVSASSALVRFSIAQHMVHRMLPAGRSVKYEVSPGEEIPSVPVDLSFYLPQWVAFDQEDRLIVQTVGEAEACIASMQRFVSILHSAVAFAPFIVADDEYQRKRYGMLGQLVNQARALARYHVQSVVQTIRQRAGAGSLNRGLWLSLPFFDDQALAMKTHNFEVIPPGRIWFVPAFVVQSARQEQVKVAQDTCLSPSTRKHLLMNLRVLEQIFYHTI